MTYCPLGSIITSLASEYPVTVSLTDVFVDLQTGHEYKVQAIAVATPPEGYLLTAPLYAGAELIAK